MGQSSPSLEGGAADRQGETQFVVLGSELETDVGQPTGMRMGKRDLALLVLRAHLNNPGKAKPV